MYICASINEGVCKHMLSFQVCVCERSQVCTCIYMGPMGRQLALSCFCLSSCRVGRVGMCIIRETPQGIVDSINPTRRRAFLIPHHTPPNSHSYQKQYEWHNAMWIQASAFMRRCDWSDLIIFLSDVSIPSECNILQQGGLNQRYQRLRGQNWYSGGSKSASFFIIQKLFVSVEKHPRFSDRIGFLWDSFWSPSFATFMKLLLME